MFQENKEFSSIFLAKNFMEAGVCAQKYQASFWRKRTVYDGADDDERIRHYIPIVDVLWCLIW